MSITGIVLAGGRSTRFGSDKLAEPIDPTRLAEQDDVLTGLSALTGLEAGPAPLLTRLAQGPLDDETGAIGDPLRSPA